MKNIINNFKSSDSIPIIQNTNDGIEQLCFTDFETANYLNESFFSVSNTETSTKAGLTFARLLATILSRQVVPFWDTNWEVPYD